MKRWKVKLMQVVPSIIMVMLWSTTLVYGRVTDPDFVPEIPAGMGPLFMLVVFGLVAYMRRKK